ncbi:MAG: glucosaminidase domain-containing protein [Candidatus Krumholzibacteriota bacterium]
MRRLAIWATSAALLAVVLPDSIHADQGFKFSGGVPDQGLRWARSAVTPFETRAVERNLGFGMGGLRPVAFGRQETPLPDFTDYRDVNAKKLRFFGFLLPMVDEENERLLDLRTRLSYIYEHVRWDRDVDTEDRVWLHDVIEEFRIPETDIHAEEFWEIALQRVDAVPDHLVLAQAANESAWGTSRFAREGNNLFGQWCFRQGCGLVPADRPEGASYEVARFDSVSQSIGSYMHNLNTGRTYQQLREIRAKARSNGHEPDATAMAAGLMSYSERGEEYITELRSMIRYNSNVIEEARARLEEGASS